SADGRPCIRHPINGHPVSGQPISGHPSADVDGLAAAVPPAVGAHHVGELRLLAVGADASRWRRQAPRAGPTAAALGLGGLLLGYGHDRSGSFWVQTARPGGGAANRDTLRQVGAPESIEGRPPRRADVLEAPARSVVAVRTARRAQSGT